MSVTAFTPGRTYQLAVSATASAQQTVNADAHSIRLLNAAPAIVYVKIGTGAQTATPNDTPLLPNVVELFFKGSGADTVAAIGGPGLLYITTGEGI